MAPRNIIQGPAMDMSYLQKTPMEGAMGGLASLAEGFSQRQKFELAQQIQKAKDKEDARRFDLNLEYKKDLADQQFGGEMHEKDWKKMEADMINNLINFQMMPPDQAAIIARNIINQQRGIVPDYKYVKDNKGQVARIDASMYDSLLADDPNLNPATKEDFAKFRETAKTADEDIKGMTGKAIDKTAGAIKYGTASALAALANLTGGTMKAGPGHITSQDMLDAQTQGPSFQDMSKASMADLSQLFQSQPQQQQQPVLPLPGAGIYSPPGMM